MIKILSGKFNPAKDPTAILGLGEKYLIKTIAKNFDIPLIQATEDFKKFGDPGLLAAEYFKNSQQSFIFFSVLFFALRK